MYQVERHVDFTVDDLPLESSRERANLDTSAQHEQHHQHDPAVRHEERGEVERLVPAGCSSEKRDLDVSHMRPRLDDQLLSIARAQVENSVSRYGRGVRWEKEGLDVHGTRWVSMYLPVWLYSYHQPEQAACCTTSP